MPATNEVSPMLMESSAQGTLRRSSILSRSAASALKCSMPRTWSKNMEINAIRKDLNGRPQVQQKPSLLSYS
jgi:hypothetical protein